MKPLFLLAFLFAVTCAFSQNGKITLSEQPADTEHRVLFFYDPPPGINLPEDIQMNVSCSDFRIKSIPLEKKDRAMSSP